MPIITISRGSYSNGRQIAEKVAERLGYECISRDILLEASEEFGIPEVKLVRALHDAPSVLERYRHGKQKYIAFIRAAFLKHVKGNNVLYHGLAGQFFLRGISHVLKIRIIADMDARVRLEMERHDISEAKARHSLKKDDLERRRWALALHGIDTVSPTLYDLVIHIRKFTVEDATDLICDCVARPQFKVTPESQKALDDLALASLVRCALVAEWPNAEVSADGAEVVVHVEAPLRNESQVCDAIRGLAENTPGVETLRVSVRPAGYS